MNDSSQPSQVTIDTLIEAGILHGYDETLGQLRQLLLSGVKAGDVAAALQRHARAARIRSDTALAVAIMRRCVQFRECEPEAGDRGELSSSKLELAKDLILAGFHTEARAWIQEAEALARISSEWSRNLFPFVSMRYAEAGSLPDAIRVGVDTAIMGEADSSWMASASWGIVGHWYELDGRLPEALAALRKASKTTDDLDLQNSFLGEADRIRELIVARRPDWREPEPGP